MMQSVSSIEAGSEGIKLRGDNFNGVMTEIHPSVRVLSMRTARNLAREWCATTNVPWPDLDGRLRALRDAGNSPKGAGRHTPPATLRDAAEMLLAPLVAPLWKDVPADIRRYGALKGSGQGGFTQVSPTERAEEMCRELSAPFVNLTLLDALMLCLRICRSDSEMRFVSLDIKLSKYKPEAILRLCNRWLVFGIFFRETEAPRKGVQFEPIVDHKTMQGDTLTAMADLLTDNLQSTHENGPSVPPDEPLPSDETPRAGKPATTQTHPEARREKDKSQVGFESYGNSSGGASLPPTEPPDEVRPKRYG
jgi:hypothetical protein